MFIHYILKSNLYFNLCVSRKYAHTINALNKIEEETGYDYVRISIINYFEQITKSGAASYSCSLFDIEAGVNLYIYKVFWCDLMSSKSLNSELLSL